MVITAQHNVAFSQDLLPVKVSGATGPKAITINGTYTSTEERLNGKIVYSKFDNVSRCLYFATDGRWWISNTATATAGKLAGFANTAPEEGLPHPTLAKAWEVHDGDAWQPQAVLASVMV